MKRCAWVVGWRNREGGLVMRVGGSVVGSANARDNSFSGSLQPASAIRHEQHVAPTACARARESAGSRVKGGECLGRSVSNGRRIGLREHRSCYSSGARSS